MQPRDADALVVERLVDRVDRREGDVDEPVDERHVDAEELDDGLVVEEGEGPDDGFCEDGLPTAVKGGWRVSSVNALEEMGR